MTNEALTKTAKHKLYKTLTRHALMYGRETWTVTKSEEQAIPVFETKDIKKNLWTNTRGAK